VRFVVADAEEVDYRTLVRAGRVDLVVANLCMTDAILKRARRCLRRRGVLVFSAVEAAQWHETGRTSQFAYTEPAMRAALARHGFVADYVGVEREVVEFEPPEQMRDGFLAGSTLEQRWRADGRWEGLERYLQSGGRSLTVRSQLIVRARKG
jgi:SAM-dependent methyltransferase